MTFLDPPCRNMEEVETSPEKTHHDLLDLMRAAAYSFQFGWLYVGWERGGR
jgi:hypothetical protein